MVVSLGPNQKIKIMKKYLCIYTGSRGELENVFEVEDAEKMATESYEDFANDVRNDPNSTQEDIQAWDSYVEEFGLIEKYDWGWSLCLGEENGEIYIDMSDPGFIEWEKMVRGKFATGEFEWTEVSDRDMWDLIDLYM